MRAVKLAWVLILGLVTERADYVRPRPCPKGQNMLVCVQRLGSEVGLEARKRGGNAISFTMQLIRRCRPAAWRVTRRWPVRN